MGIGVKLKSVDPKEGVGNREDKEWEVEQLKREKKRERERVREI